MGIMGENIEFEFEICIVRTRSEFNWIKNVHCCSLNISSGSHSAFACKFIKHSRQIVVKRFSAH